MAFGPFCFSSEDEAAMAASLAQSITTTSSVPSFAFSPSPSPPSPSSPTLETCSPLSTPQSSSSSMPSPLRFSLPSTTSRSAPARAPAPLAPWWRRLLDALWVGAKMCLMFSLMSVLWVILAVPTIDQQLRALFRAFSSAADGHDEAWKPDQRTRKPSRARRAETRQQGSGALRIREDGDTTAEARPRLSGSQELKKSEEGDNATEETKGDDEQTTTTAPAGESDLSALTEEATKPKRKKRVRWSDDASSHE